MMTTDPLTSALNTLYSPNRNVNTAAQTLTSPMSLRSFCKRTGTALLALSCGVGIFAASNNKAMADTGAFSNLAALSAQDTIQLSYLILMPAAHKFGKARSAAMADLRDAGALCGIQLQGKGVSD